MKADERRLLVSDIHNPFSHLPRLKNPLSAGYIDVGEVYAEGCHDQLEEDAKTASIIKAKLRATIEKALTRWRKEGTHLISEEALQAALNLKEWEE